MSKHRWGVCQNILTFSEREIFLLKMLSYKMHQVSISLTLEPPIHLCKMTLSGGQSDQHMQEKKQGIVSKYLKMQIIIACGKP